MKSLNDIINEQVKFYRIEICPERFKSSVGRAWINNKVIKIPNINSLMDFMVALHEIGHIANGYIKPKYKEEYLAEKWAIETAKHYGIEYKPYIIRAKRYVIMNIAKAFIRKLNIDNVDDEIKAFIKDFEPNLNSWKNYKKIYVYGWAKGEFKIEKIK